MLPPSGVSLQYCTSQGLQVSCGASSGRHASTPQPLPQLDTHKTPAPPPPHAHAHAGSKVPAGSMLLGSSPGGALSYVEPPAAVPLNNELVAALGEAATAEEEVLYDLSARLMGVQQEVEAAFEVGVRGPARGSQWGWV